VHLRPGTRLLDVATGPGVLAAEVAKRGARAVGIDLSPQMIELAAAGAHHEVLDFHGTFADAQAALNSATDG